MATPDKGGEQQGGKWGRWLGAGAVLALLGGVMALVMVGGMLRTTITAPNFGLLAMCIHGAGWDGGILPGDPEVDPSADPDPESEEDPGEQPGEENDQDSDAEPEPGDEGPEGEETEEDGGDGNEDGQGEEDGEEGGSSEPGEGDGEGSEGGGQEPQPWWPEDPEDWASVLPGMEEPALTPVVHTASWTGAAAAPAAPSLVEGAWVPKDMLTLYKAAGEHWRMDWAILASIGFHESRHGTDPDTLTENEWTALGPMQFVRSAWAHHGVYPDGRPGTPPLEDRLDAPTAIWSAANKLTDQGIRTNERAALHAYNRSWVYVTAVQVTAERFRSGNFEVRDAVGAGEAPEGSGGGDIPAGTGSGTEADFEDCFELLGDVLGPAGASAVLGGGVVARAPDELTQAVVDWALSQEGKPYIWGGTGPAGYDCSGLVMQAYASVGLRMPRVTHDQVNFGSRVSPGDVQAGDLVFFDVNGNCGINCGPQPRHVGMVVDPDRKLMIEAWCTNCGPITTRSWADRSDNIHAFTRPLADPTAAALVESRTGD